MFFLRVFASSRELSTKDSGSARCGCGQWARARGSEHEGVLPPHPRPLSPCGGEGGLVGSFQLAVFSSGVFFLRVFASSRELNTKDSGTARCGCGQWARARGSEHEGVWPPHPRPLSGCGGEGGLVASFQFSILSFQ